MKASFTWPAMSDTFKELLPRTTSKGIVQSLQIQTLVFRTIYLVPQSLMGDDVAGRATSRSFFEGKDPPSDQPFHQERPRAAYSRSLRCPGPICNDPFSITLLHWDIMLQNRHPNLIHPMRHTQTMRQRSSGSDLKIPVCRIRERCAGAFLLRDFSKARDLPRA